MNFLLKEEKTNWKYILIVVILASIVGGGILWLSTKQETQFTQIPEIKIPEKVEEEITELNIPGSWFFIGGAAPPGNLLFHEDGVLEFPEWISGDSEKTKLRWDYSEDEKLLTINFELIPNLFPENEEIAQDLFGNVEEGSWMGSFIGYNKQELSISIRVTSETIALEFFGWIFYNELFYKEEILGDWKTYRNEEYGFEVKYPEGWKTLESAVLYGDEIHKVTFLEKEYELWQADFELEVLSNPQKLSIQQWHELQLKKSDEQQAQCKKEDSNAPCLSLRDLLRGKEEITFEGQTAYKISIFDFDRTRECIQTARWSYVYSLCYDGSNPNDPDFTKHREITNKMLSTFSFIEGLPKEIKNNKDFIDWIQVWQRIKPIYTLDTFAKVVEGQFSLNGDTINTEELEQAMEGIESPYFPEERKNYVKIYSPDRTKFIFNAGYPNPLEVDQDIVFFDLSTNKYQYLKTCGTACWFEKVFWISDNQFAIIRIGEYSPETYEHSIFLYNLEKKLVKEYRSSEIILQEELQKFKSR